MFLIVHPNPIFDDNINSYLSAICYLKIIPIYLYLSKNNLYYGCRYYFLYVRSARVLAFYGQMHKLTNIQYSIKCLFKRNGLLLNIFLLFFATIILSAVSI